MNRALVVILLAASSCGPTGTPAGVVCGPNNCAGCCSSSETCDPGTTPSRCGKGGGSCNSCLSPAPLCVEQVCGVEPLPAGAKFVFVTRTTYTGNLGGLAGADGLCAAAASAGSLPGTWRAWISNTVLNRVNAFDRIQGEGPWYLPGVNSLGRRVKIFNNKASLRTAPLAPIDHDELGTRLLAGRLVWTGTDPTGNATTQGTVTDNSCANWTEDGLNRGLVGDVYAGWTNQADTNCSTMASLYCFQQ